MDTHSLDRSNSDMPSNSQLLMRKQPILKESKDSALRRQDRPQFEEPQISIKDET